MLSNTKREENIIVDALSRRYTLLTQLDYNFLGWKQLKINIYMMVNLKMYCCIVKMAEPRTNSSSMMDLCLELTSYAFYLAPFVCCCYRKRMEGA
jgi:hypothetical protein